MSKTEYYVATVFLMKSEGILFEHIDYPIMQLLRWPLLNSYLK